MSALTVAALAAAAAFVLGWMLPRVFRAGSTPTDSEPKAEDLAAEVLLHELQRDRQAVAARREMRTRFDTQVRRWERGDWSDTPRYRDFDSGSP